MPYFPRRKKKEKRKRKKNRESAIAITRWRSKERGVTRGFFFFKKEFFFFFFPCEMRQIAVRYGFSSVRDLIFSLFSSTLFANLSRERGGWDPSPLPRNYLEKEKKTVPPPPTEFSQEVKDKKSPERSRKKRKSAGNGANSFSRQKNSPYYKSTGSSSVFCHTFGEFSYFFPERVF